MADEVYIYNLRAEPIAVNFGDTFLFSGADNRRYVFRQKPVTVQVFDKKTGADIYRKTTAMVFEPLEAGAPVPENGVEVTSNRQLVSMQLAKHVIARDGKDAWKMESREDIARKLVRVEKLNAASLARENELKNELAAITIELEKARAMMSSKKEK